MGILQANENVNRDAHENAPTPETEECGSGSTHCSPPCRAVVNDGVGKPSAIIVIPDDITGSVTVDYGGQAFQYVFNSGHLTSVSAEYGPKTVA